MTTLLHTRGIAKGFRAPVLGRVTYHSTRMDDTYFLLSPSTLPRTLDKGLGVLTCQRDVLNENFQYPIIHRLPTLDHLQEGDFIVVNPEGHVNTLYRVNSSHNSLLVTERCNSNCLMCSQPPKDRDDTAYFMHLYEQLIPQLPKDCAELGITGGEPTLLGSEFFRLLFLIKEQMPATELHILTNGRQFASPEFTNQFADLNYQKSMLGIPLYADYYAIHDHVVQAKGAFNQTLKGLYNLARHNQRIELRIVLHRLTIPRLTRLAQFIAKNLPFVEHVAFMGLENTGYTPHNFNQLWIDPVNYQDELKASVELLANGGYMVSIYNSQLCVLPEQLWPFNRKSISDWKNIYLTECDQCSKLTDCGGLFASTILKGHSNYIKAFT